MTLRPLPRFERAALGALLALAACDVSEQGTGTLPSGVTDAASAADTSVTVVADAAMPDASPPASIGVSDVDVYPGRTAEVTATSIATFAVATWSWSLVSAPAGSGVTPASVAAATGAKLAIAPDLVGDYVVRVTGTTADAVSESATATVHADAAPVFYTRAVFGANGGEVEVRVAGHDGSGDRAVACAIAFAESESAQYRSRTLFAAATTTDVWEAQAGQPSRFAFSGTRSLTADDAGAFAAFLIAGTARDSCTSSPVTLRAMAAPAGAFGQPRFAPDGARLAFLDPVGSGFAVATIAIDGSDYRSLAPVLAAPPPGGPGESANVRPEWVDATHVAWARPLGGSAWSVMVAADVASPTATPPSTLMTCLGASTPHRIAFLADGSLLAAYAPAAGQPTDLFVLAPGANQACGVVRNLTKLSGAASRAHDFDVSPDGRTVAYLHYDATAHGGAGATGNEGDLYTVMVDGSAAPKAVGPTPLVGRIGPRWIGDGTRLAWTRAGTVADGGDARLADNVSVISPDGTDARDLATGDGVGVVVGAVGPGGSCAAGRTSGAPAGLVVASIGAIAGALGGRRRRVLSRVLSRRRR